MLSTSSDDGYDTSDSDAEQNFIAKENKIFEFRNT
jgi:hypothetical protein